MTPRPNALPTRLLAVAALYFIATAAHFGHNAEYIAFYPGMPDSLTRETVYLAWSGITAVGVLAMALLRLGLPAPALFVLALYGAFGLDALLHYTLALCSEHTLWANVTIWSEAATGLLLLLVSAVLLARHIQEAASGYRSHH